MANYKGLVGICLTKIHMVNTPVMLHKIIDALREANYRTVILDLYNSDKIDKENNVVEFELLDSIDIKKLDIVILLSETIITKSIRKSLVKRLLNEQCPIINIGEKTKGCFNIYMNHLVAFKQIVEHVIEYHKCDNIYYMSGVKGNAFSDAREKVFIDTLKEHNIPIDESKVAYGQFWEYPTRIACEKWLDGSMELPSAIICANDIMAMTVYECVNAKGLSVPEDIIITGFDGIDIRDDIAPKLTTAANDFDGVCNELVGLCDKIKENKELSHFDIDVPHKVYISESCGCERREKPTTYEYNRRIMGMYSDVQQHNHEIDRIFDILEILTDCDSVMSMLNKFKDAFFSDTLSNMQRYNFAILVNQSYCKNTDLPTPKVWNDATGYEIISVNNTNITFPMRLLNEEEKFELIKEISGSEGQILAFPLSWQNENFGVILMEHSKEYIDYNELYEFTTCINQVFSVVLKKSQLHDLIIRDTLTHLFNRRGYFAEVSRLVKLNPGRHKIAVISSIDMDNLKEINDEFGHSEGDYCLETIGNAMGECIDEGGVCARFGGDEFMIAFIMDESKFDYDRYYNLVNKIPGLIIETKEKDNKPFDIGVSMGFAFGEVNKIGDIDTIMKNADDDMYSIKVKHHNGRNVRSSRRDED
ncbi:MAG: GGDEF domain-containing protein [Lachnospiraceae bacterium]|nr:GGDEF domain-containing protein [Lachnospiraceae bacterium]